MRDCGHCANREYQFVRGNTNCDVRVCGWLKIECKVGKSHKIQDAYEQAKRATGPEFPCVYAKRDRCPAVVFIHPEHGERLGLGPADGVLADLVFYSADSFESAMRRLPRKRCDCFADVDGDVRDMQGDGDGE